MKKFFVILALAAAVFAQQNLNPNEDGDTNANRTEFMVESISYDEITDFNIDLEIAINNAVDAISSSAEEESQEFSETASAEEIEDIAALEKIAAAQERIAAANREEETPVASSRISNEITVRFSENILVDELSYEAIEAERALKDGLARIMFTLSENAVITCRFINTNEDKTIEILCLEGNRILEVQTTAEQDFVSINGDRLEKGIYIFRVLSSNTKTPLFSQAFIIG